MKDELDEGSALGGTASVLAWAGVALVAAQAVIATQWPETWRTVGWIPGLLAAFAAALAMMTGTFSLISEQSPRGRRQARRGAMLGTIILIVQLALVGSVAGLTL